MSTPLKTTENMTKHLTAAERAARTLAESTLRRPRVSLRVPKWLGDDAKKIFDATRRKMAGLELLDNVDADLLALYADAISRYITAARDSTSAPKDIQAWSRVALSYADKLGISPTARARLARRKAEAPPLDDMDQFLGDVTEYVNGGR